MFDKFYFINFSTDQVYNNKDIRKNIENNISFDDNYYTKTKIKADKLIASIPLKLWFSNAYKNPKDKWDRHYHEFEDWQLDWLLEKTGWEIKERAYWKNPSSKIGIRPLLRNITPRYYAVYAERKQN